MHRLSTLSTTAKPLLAHLTPWLPSDIAAAAWDSADAGHWAEAVTACLAEIIPTRMPLTDWEHHWLTQLAQMLHEQPPTDSQRTPDLRDETLATAYTQMVASLHKVATLRDELDSFVASCGIGFRSSALDELLAAIDSKQLAIDPAHRNILRELWLAENHHGWVISQLNIQKGQPSIRPPLPARRRDRHAA